MIQYPTTAAALQAHGIDPATVAQDGLHEGGYIAFVLDENGKRQLNPETGKVRAEHKEWPTPAARHDVLTAFLLEGGVLA